MKICAMQMIKSGKKESVEGIELQYQECFRTLGWSVGWLVGIMLYQSLHKIFIQNPFFISIIRSISNNSV